jgi:hypothetical protein
MFKTTTNAQPNYYYMFKTTTNAQAKYSTQQHTRQAHFYMPLKKKDLYAHKYPNIHKQIK